MPHHVAPLAELDVARIHCAVHVFAHVVHLADVIAAYDLLCFYPDYASSVNPLSVWDDEGTAIQVALNGGCQFALVFPFHLAIFASAGGNGFGDRIADKTCPQGTPNLALLFSDPPDFRHPKDVLVRSSLPLGITNPFEPIKQRVASATANAISKAYFDMVDRRISPEAMTWDPET